jgi:hypothetical protein
VVGGRCRWSAKRKAIAKSGDITSLHGLLFLDSPDSPGAPSACTGKTAVPAARGAKIDQLLAARTAVRTPSPAFVKEAVKRGYRGELEGDEDEGAAGGLTAAAITEAPPAAPPAKKTAEELEQEARRDAEAADLTKTLGEHMGWYVEFPHVDGRFNQVW